MKQMSIYSFPSTIKKIAIILVALGITPFLFAQEPNSKEENLSRLQKEARLYRSQGLELQQIGNLDAALSLYQKAIELDPGYAVAYNDAGIIYEANGSLERAEESYLKCIKIDPYYLSVYSNLALLYENKRDLDKASFYWQKRSALGSPDDPWTEKARQRLADIQLVLQGNININREQEVIGLIEDVVDRKDILKESNQALAEKYFEEAKQDYAQEDYASAIKKALDAQQLEPANTKEIEEFIEKVQIRALSR